MNRNLNVAIKLAVLTVIFTTLACGSATPPAPSSNAVATIVAGTLQAITALASPATQAPTAAPLPTSTLAPTSAPIPPASNLPPATRITFTTGGTQSVIEGSIGAAQTLHYVIKALKDQPMLVTLTPPDGVLSVFGANGTILLPASQQQSGWQGVLPATQDYYLDITRAGGSPAFSLSVIIPARIKFAAGQNKTTITGQAVNHYPVTYVAYALGGQKMDVTIDTDPGEAALTIWGFSDGQPYARAQNGITDFSMTLPSTQDYIIEVVPHTDQTVNYTVKIKIQ